MKVHILDRDALSAVRPLDIAAYLRTNGWTELDPSGPASLWEKMIPDHGATDVLVPQEQTWRDYARRVQDVLERLAGAEGRSELAVLRDIGEVAADVVRLRAANGGRSDGTIPLEDGVRLGNAVERMFLAAACSAVQPRRAYHTRKPKIATDYVAGLRLGQTERGSYVVTVLSPVSPALSTAQLTFPGEEPVPPEEPYARKVVRILGGALHTVQRAAGRGAASGKLDAFEAEVRQGVSADLCEALAELRECAAADAFRIRIGWAPVRPGPRDVPTSVMFATDTLDVIKEAGRILREKSPIDDFTVTGWVVDLARPEHPVCGKATVLTSVDGRLRKVTIELSGDDWALANEALKGRLVLACDGELSRDTRPFQLRNPRNIHLLIEDD